MHSREDTGNGSWKALGAAPGLPAPSRWHREQAAARLTARALPPPGASAGSPQSSGTRFKFLSVSCVGCDYLLFWPKAGTTWNTPFLSRSLFPQEVHTPLFFFFFNPLKSTPQDTPSPQECTIKEATTTIEFSLVMMHMSFPLSSLEFLFQHHNLYFQLKDSAALPMPPGIFPSQPKVRLAWESISKDGKTKFLRSLNANFKTITNKSNGKQLWNNS